MSNTSFSFSLLFLLALQFSCAFGAPGGTNGTPSQSEPDPGVEQPANELPSDNNVPANGGDQSAGPETCTSTDSCPSGKVCAPDILQCVASLACTEHSDCGKAAHCQDSGQCARSQTGSPCATDDHCAVGESCTSGFCGCRGEAFGAEAIAPNVLIALDRSGSMDDDLDGTNDTKWDISVAAINELVNNFGNAVRFGLALYSSGSSCGAGQVNIDVAEGTADTIMAQLSTVDPGGSTPIGATLEALLDYPDLKDPTRENFILLLTDGKEGCDNDSVAINAVKTLEARDSQVKTFVVGFGSEVDVDLLNGMAQAGGTALADPVTSYYQADDAASLIQAFDDIGSSVLSCDFALTDVPDGADLYVYIDGENIVEDTQQGWSYDASRGQLGFTGAACDKLQSGASDELVVLHDCPEVIK